MLKFVAGLPMACSVTMPHRPARRRGRTLLLATAAIAVGGAIAVRAERRNRTVPPAPAAASQPAAGPAVAPPLLPAPSRTSGPARSLARMAAGGAVAVVLAITAAVVAAPPGGERSAVPRTVVTRSAGPHGMYVEVVVPAPAARHERVTLTGDDGSRIEVGAAHQLDQPSYDDASKRNVFYTVHIHNSGTVPIDGRLGRDCWAVDPTGATYRADPMRSHMLDLSDREGRRLEPGWDVELTVGFVIPDGARLIRLHIAVPMGSTMSTAEWNL